MAYSYAAATIGANTGSNTTSASTSTVIDANHPYFLHSSDNSSDNPGTPLVTQVLTEHNYHQWNRSISIALSAKLKLGLIDGSVVKPTGDATRIALWNRCNDMVVSWLLNSVSTEIRNSVAYLATAKQIWDDLATRFSQTNMPRIFQLRKELASISQGNMSVTSYFTKFKTLVAEIDNLAHIPKCVCATNACTCNNRHKLEQYEEMIKLSQFLMGLGDQFTAIRGQLLIMNPVPSLNQAFSLLLQEESQRELAAGAHTPITETMAMNVKYTPSFKSKSGAPSANTRKSTADVSLVCDYCQNSGHTKDKCFCLHGYPEWHRLHGKPKPKPRKLNTSGTKHAAVNVTVPASQHTTDIQHTDSFQKESSTGFTDMQCQ